MTTYCRVFGNPIYQSKSPIIHQKFAEQFSLPLRYDKCDEGLEDFESAVVQFFQHPSAIGANVTLPFKTRAFAMADELSAHAKRAGAVNTLVKRDGLLLGDNTDGRGLVWDLARNGITLAGKSVLLVGAGGAAKGAIPALLDANITALTIYNRTLETARELVNTYADTREDCEVALYQQADGFDVVINATSLSLNHQLPDIDDDVFRRSGAFYDMVYLDEPTIFMQHAASLGAKQIIDGLGMLVGQAAESFALWFGQTPEVDPVINYLKKSAY